MIPKVPVPTLATDRLRLRAWSDMDVGPLTEINRDPEVAQWLGEPDPSLTGQRIAGYVEHWRTRGFGQWAVEEAASGVFIGRVGLIHHDDWTASAHDAEIGWTLSRTVWGRGYATEAARAALEWAAGRSGLETIISITLPGNLRSRRVMEKLGLTYQGSAVWHGFEQVWYATRVSRTRS